ncbi:Fic family protein [Tenacibaculum finnmarkense]|uniref:Fic family protein n=1 Tax=Tenacibaculum finnmarkense TaxID=2781243 RepID=UPI001E4BE32E|nr:Fic family protein [Tenacibaculum finnmarkense]MCD8440969.1 Fic family protein [Tenacibaculum finnmarkense genomovar ulcerans]MCG8721892.1 Fic family protein [Tenacibaculum finnmarkense]
MYQIKKLDKLPPKREKVETLKILRQLSKSSKSLGELKGIAQTMPNQEMLINAVVLQEAKDSSEIENIITTQDELYKALATKTKQGSQVKEVINYRKAIFSGQDLLKKQGFLRLKDIEFLQKTIIENNAGVRNMAGTVLKNDKTGEVVYTPPQEKYEILDLLGNFLEHFNIKQDDFPPLINLAILHYQFESIHPFYDGNGRTGRILNILYLIINELLDIPILYLSSYINENKSDYYRLLNKVNTSDQWEEYILYILKAIEVTSDRTIQKINAINNLLSKTIEIVQEKEPKIYRKELIELLFEQPYSKIEYVVQKLNVERKSASRYLNSLEKIGIISSEKVGRENIYVNKKLIEILKKN